MGLLALQRLMSVKRERRRRRQRARSKSHGISLPHLLIRLTLLPGVSLVFVKKKDLFFICCSPTDSF